MPPHSERNDDIIAEAFKGLARKELREEVTQMRKVLSTHRSDIAELKRLDVAHHLPPQQDWQAVEDMGGSRIIVRGGTSGCAWRLANQWMP